MNSLTKIGYLSVLSLVILFSSCVNNEVTSILLSKQDLTMKLGQSDSLNLTVGFTGDINKQPVTFSVADSKIVSVALGITQDETKTTATSFTKNIVVKALSTGSTTVSVQVGSKTTKMTVAITQTSVTFTQISVSNYGPALYDLYDINNNYLSVQLTSGTAAYNAILNKFTGTGKILIMNVFVPLSSNNIEPRDSAYYASNTADAFTFFPGYDDGTYYQPALIIDVINGVRTIQLISDGTFKVTKNTGGNFQLIGDMHSDVDGIVHFSYNGNITPEDKQQKDQTSTFTSGSLDYHADWYASGLSNTYELFLKSSTDSMSLFINTSLTAKDSIPSGKYPLITLPLTSTTQLKPYTIIPGYVDDDGTYLYRMGSWYWGVDKLRLETGSADISRIGTNYLINYELYNHFGVKFSGVYSGPLTYTNKTSSGVKAAKVGGVSKVSSIHQKTIVNKSIGRMAY